jgi:hypothetical protein
MYEYHDIGIALDVIPKYHLDDSIFVDLNVEVSSLGQNLGTATAPAFAIGTRNVHTTMILRESETAVLGGLISETEQHSLNGLLLETGGDRAAPGRALPARCLSAFPGRYSLCQFLHTEPERNARPESQSNFRMRS